MQDDGFKSGQPKRPTPAATPPSKGRVNHLLRGRHPARKYDDRPQRSPAGEKDDDSAHAHSRTCSAMESSAAVEARVISPHEESHLEGRIKPRHRICKAFFRLFLIRHQKSELEVLVARRTSIVDAKILIL